MLPHEEFPDELAHLDALIRDLRRAVEKTPSASAVGLAAARIHLKYITRIEMYSDRLHEIIGFELLANPLPVEEFIPRLNTSLRLMSKVNKMICEQISGLLDCFGGPATIGIQQLVEWGEGDPGRREIILSFLAKRTRRPPR
jgi:hypothetical protein